MSSYTTTHPWINFRIQVERIIPELWILLGECQSKCVHIAKTPLTPEIAAELHRVYLAKGAAASAAIEGNTLNLRGKNETHKSI